MSLLDQTCSIQRRTAGTATDIYGEATKGTTTVTGIPCDVQQIRREEPGQAGEFSVSEWWGFFPAGTGLDTGDAVVHPTKGTFEVTGEPYDADQGSSAVSHMEATLKRTAGAA